MFVGWTRSVGLDACVQSKSWVRPLPTTGEIAKPVNMKRLPSEKSAARLDCLTGPSVGTDDRSALKSVLMAPEQTSSQALSAQSLFGRQAKSKSLVETSLLRL